MQTVVNEKPVRIIKKGKLVRETKNSAPPEKKITVPFLRPELNEFEIQEVVDTLRSGWLTTGPKVKTFEQDFSHAVRAKTAVAVNSCTAALHLAVEALGLKAGQAVLVPTMTFAATAEILLYKNAVPIPVDCDETTANMNLVDAREKIEKIRAGKLRHLAAENIEIVGIIPVHVGGLMMNVAEIKSFAKEFGLWIIEDAAHSFPAAWRENEQSDWQFCGENTADVTCFSFYANKTITTGEGGMAVTDNQEIADRMRLMSLHGLSNDAWMRYAEKGGWDYRIVAPGYKYNLTDIAASIGIHQLKRAEEMRQRREEIAAIYRRNFANVKEFALPPDDINRIHSWHLFPIRLDLSKLLITRNDFIEELKRSGVGCSVHWRPLHLHPFYELQMGWKQDDLPVATKIWETLISLPIFPSMRVGEINHVIQTVKKICHEHTKRHTTISA